MAIWLARAGGHGEYEQQFLQDKRIYLTWDEFDKDLRQFDERPAVIQALRETYPEEKEKALLNWGSQVWPFAHVMQVGDWVVLPSKSKPTIHVGEIKGDYCFDAQALNPFFHWRPVQWFAPDVPRAHFGKDLLFSFGAFMTICRIQRNDAEARLKAMANNGWKPETTLPFQTGGHDADDSEGDAAKDYEELAKDDISRFIMARFKGHDLARLIEAVLRAQGFVTHLSPPGPDGGVDILAAGGPFGFSEPRLCVQVKSQNSPIEAAVLAQLKGAMEDTRSSHGILVAWGGFKNSIAKEVRSNFFRVQLWGQNEVLAQIFANYENLPEDIRAELPLKRIWTLVQEQNG